jgi:hypothetical protein
VKRISEICATPWSPGMPTCTTGKGLDASLNLFPAPVETGVSEGNRDLEESSLTRYNRESLPYYARSGRNEESVCDNVYPVRKIAETSADQYRLSN